MGMCRQGHAPAALLTGNGPGTHFYRRLCGARGPFWMATEKKNSSFPLG